MEEQEALAEQPGLIEKLSVWLGETPVRWQTMWDANELTTQLFFVANFVIALYIAAIPFRTSGKDITAVNRGIMLVFGLGYAILVLIAYLQLVPTFSPYE